jgi:hypothetical protein
VTAGGQAPTSRRTRRERPQVRRLRPANTQLVVAVLLPFLPTVVAGRGSHGCSLYCEAVRASGRTGGWALVLYACWVLGLVTAVVLRVRLRAVVEGGTLTLRTLLRTRTVPLAEIAEVVVVSRRIRCTGGQVDARVVVRRTDGHVVLHTTDGGAVWQGARFSDLLLTAGVPVTRDHRTRTPAEFARVLEPRAPAPTGTAGPVR